MDDVKLLPCPFCGGEPTFDDWNTSYRPDSKPLWGVVCKSSKCAGEIGFFNTDPAIAQAEWNTRPLPTDEEVERAALAAAVEHDKQDGKGRHWAAIAYKAGSCAVEYWNAISRAALIAGRG